ncbi:hypothetical protein DXO22_24130, partial [Salmonella enterica]|nr:hypothetical protein [Salmonella enterica]
AFVSVDETSDDDAAGVAPQSARDHGRRPVEQPFQERRLAGLERARRRHQEGRDQGHDHAAQKDGMALGEGGFHGGLEIMISVLAEARSLANGARSLAKTRL